MSSEITVDRPPGPWRYARLLGMFARQCLVREMSFRANFLARVAASAFWVGITVLYLQLIYRNTERIGDWTRDEYLFFMGTTFLINGVLHAFFMDNCSNLAEMIRTGDLDFALLKPVDEQFLLSTQRIDWAEFLDFVVGIILITLAVQRTGVELTFGAVAGYLFLFAAGVVILYSLMISLAASSVWLVRNGELFELWWYLTQFGRYPREIYAADSAVGLAVRFGLTYVLPVLLAMNLPARWVFRDKQIDPWLIGYLVFAAVGTFAASRWFFKQALAAYRSASS